MTSLHSFDSCLFLQSIRADSGITYNAYTIYIYDELLIYKTVALVRRACFLKYFRTFPVVWVFSVKPSRALTQSLSCFMSGNHRFAIIPRDDVMWPIFMENKLSHGNQVSIHEIKAYE